MSRKPDGFGKLWKVPRGQGMTGVADVHCTKVTISNVRVVAEELGARVTDNPASGVPLVLGARP